MKTGPVTVRRATAADHDAIWKIFHEVVAPGDTYTFDPNISRRDALAYWFSESHHVYAAYIDCLNQPRADGPGGIVGTYILRANQSGGGSHVANAAFMVAAEARGQGVGLAMARHSLAEARRLGFRAMQFNFVVSTNESALRLWKKLGFQIVGTLPLAFRHPIKGEVDAYIMFRSLVEA